MLHYVYPPGISEKENREIKNKSLGAPKNDTNLQIEKVGLTETWWTVSWWNSVIKENKKILRENGLSTKEWQAEWRQTSSSTLDAGWQQSKSIWFREKMTNCQAWGILEIFLGIDGFSKFTFNVPVIWKKIWEN